MKLLLTSLIITTSTFGFASKESEGLIYKKIMQGGTHAIEAYQEIYANNERISAINLFMGAGIAFKEKKFKEAAFLFYIAKFRAQFDKDLFPPTGTGGNSPMVLFGALSHQMGSAINPEIMKRPSEYSKAIELASNWLPRVPSDYHPGWEYEEKGDIAECIDALKLSIADFNKGMNGFASLLNDPEYFEAFRTVQDYNLIFDDTRPSEEEKEKAIAKMTEIEKRKNIRGMYYNPEKE